MYNAECYFQTPQANIFTMQTALSLSCLTATDPSVLLSQ